MAPPRKHPIPKIDQIRSVLNYWPDTGKLTWKKGGKGIWFGKEAGCVKQSDGYRYLHLFGSHYMAHQVVWAHFHGVWPCGYIDHRNRIRDDNRIDNLRVVTPLQNSWNASICSNNKSGYRGVWWSNREDKWMATICVRNKIIRLGAFDEVTRASAAYKAAAKEYYGEYAP